MSGKSKLASVSALGAAVVGVVAFGGPAGAATLTWDTDLTNNGVITDGAGNWNKTVGNTIWSDGASNVVWTDLNDAVFGGTAGTPGAVTIGTVAVRANNITFNKPYTISDTSTTIRLILDGNVVANETSTINANRGALMQANQPASSNVNWTVAADKSLTFNNLQATSQFIVGGNAMGGRSLTVNGAGTLNFTAPTDAFSLAVPADSTLNMQSGTLNLSRRTTGANPDHIALVIRGGAVGGAFTQTGGLVTLGTAANPGILNVATSTNPGAYNLNGGTLETGKIVGSTTGASSAGNFNFNGGTLRATAGNGAVGATALSVNFMAAAGAGGMTATTISTNGATIDSNGFTINIDQILAHNVAGAPTDGGLTKIGLGTLNLTAVNTYNGDTTVSAGTLTLADDAALKFVFGATGANNSIEGIGTALLNGDFTFDLTGASTTPGSSWLVVNNATLNETFGGTFTVAGFTDAGSDLWTLPIDANSDYVFSEATGTLAVVAVPEPTALAAFGLAAGALMRRRRNG